MSKHRQLYQHLVTTNSFGIKDKIDKERKPFKPVTKPSRR